MWLSITFWTRSALNRHRTSRFRGAIRPCLEPLDDRILLTGGWAAARATNGTTSARGVALDPSGAAAYVVGSELAKYTTDGQLLWSRDLGGNPYGGCNVAVDSSGDALVAGTFSGTLSLGSQTLTSAGDNDAFVGAFDPSGTLLWARSFGGPGDDEGTGIALDAGGAAYVTGRFSGTVNFDDAHVLASPGDLDAFVLKLGGSGNVLYATQAGGTGRDMGIGLAVDGGGRAYVTGYFAGTASFGPIDLTATGADAGFLAQLDDAGNFVWARSMGGPDAAGMADAQAQGVAVDGNGHVFATGTFNGTTAFGDGGNGAGAASLTALGKIDAFVTSLDAATGRFLWTRQIGGASSTTHGYGLAVDSVGNVYTVGGFNGPGAAIDGDPGPGTAILASTTTNYFLNGYISELSPTGSFLGVWQVGAGGNTYAVVNGITLGADGSVYTAGRLHSTANIDTGTHYTTLTSSGTDGFVSRMTPGQSVIFGQVFSDDNRNGVMDGSEAPLAGVTVYLDANHNGKLDRNELSTTTNAQGGYSFYHLAAGSYTVREKAPFGYTLTTPSALNVILGVGQFDDGTVFGNFKKKR